MAGFPDDAAAAVDVKRVAAFELLERRRCEGGTVHFGSSQIGGDPSKGVRQFGSAGRGGGP
jgi:hypothetical protein